MSRSPYHDTRDGWTRGETVVREIARKEDVPTDAALSIVYGNSAWDEWTAKHAEAFVRAVVDAGYSSPRALKATANTLDYNHS